MFTVLRHATWRGRLAADRADGRPAPRVLQRDSAGTSLPTSGLPEVGSPGADPARQQGLLEQTAASTASRPAGAAAHFHGRHAAEHHPRGRVAKARGVGSPHHRRRAAKHHSRRRIDREIGGPRRRQPHDIAGGDSPRAAAIRGRARHDLAVAARTIRHLRL